MRTDEVIPCEHADEVTREDRHRALPPRPPAPPDRGARRAAVPPGAHLGLRLHGPRAGGRGGGGGLRARPRRRVRAAQPRARLPPRPRRHGRAGVPQLPRQGRLPHARPRRQHALRRAGAWRLPARLDARRPLPGDRRRRARVQAAARAARRADVLGRRGDEHRRRARGHEPRGRPARAGRVRAAVQRLRVLHADEPSDAQHLHGRPRRGRLGHPRDARRRQRRRLHAGRGARGGRARPRRRGPAGGRGRLAAARRPCRARRRQLHGSDTVAGVRGPARPGRAPGGAAAPRRALRRRTRRAAGRRRPTRSAPVWPRPRPRPRRTPRPSSTASTPRS